MAGSASGGGFGVVVPVLILAGEQTDEGWILPPNRGVNGAAAAA